MRMRPPGTGRMTVTLDANVVLFASDAASEPDDRALALVEELAAGPELVYLFWPTIMAYLRIATHPAVFERPLARGIEIRDPFI